MKSDSSFFWSRSTRNAWVRRDERLGDVAQIPTAIRCASFASAAEALQLPRPEVPGRTTKHGLLRPELLAFPHGGHWRSICPQRIEQTLPLRGRERAANGGAHPDSGPAPRSRARIGATRNATRIPQVSPTVGCPCEFEPDAAVDGDGDSSSAMVG